MTVCLILTLLPATALAADGWTEVSSADALSAALSTGGNIKLTDNITVDSKQNWNVTEDVVLDLNNHVITSTCAEINNYIMAVNGASLTVTDNSAEKNGKIAATDSSYGYGIQLGGTGSSFTLLKGTIETTQETVDIYDSARDSKITISGGKLISTADSVLGVRGTGTIVDITDGELDSNGRCGVYISCYGAPDSIEFTMTGGTFTHTGGASGAIQLYKGATVTIGGDASITSSSYAVQVQENTILNVEGGHLNTTGFCAISSGETSTVNIRDGEITSPSTAIRSEDTSAVNINGGVIKATGTSPAVNAQDDSRVTITDGTFEGKQNISQEKDNVTIAGGKFEEDVSEYLPDGMAQDDDGNVGVSDDAVAMIDGTPYLTLQDAVDAVETSEKTTITLRRNANGDGVVVPNGKNIVFDLNTFTYDIDGETVGSSGTETNGFQLNRDSTITLKNGTISSSKAKILIQNYSDLTLDHVKLDGTNITRRHTLSNNFGDVKIIDSTIIAPANGVAFDVYYWPEGGYSDGVSVTVEGESVINGNIEYGGDDTATNVAAKAKLNITDGTFTGEFVIGKLGESAGAAIAISGGNFAQPVNEDYIVPGMMRDENGDIVVDPEAGDGEKIAAMIDGKTYTDLQDAVEAAEDGDVVKVFPGNHNLSYGGNYNDFLLKIDNSITLMGVDYNGDPITDPTQTKANIYSTDYVENGIWANQNLITVTADDVIIQGLTIMNKIAPNKSIEVVGSTALNTFTVRDCKFAPISEELLADLDSEDLDKYPYEEYKEYGASLYFSESGKYPMTATVEDNWFYYSGITLGGTTAGTYNITGNSFEGAKNWNKNLDYYYSTIGYQGKWLNPELHTLGTANVNISQNTFKNAGSINFSQVTDPDSGMPVFSNNTGLDVESISGPVKVDNETLVDSQEALKVALENAKGGETIVLADSFTITSPIVVDKDITIDGNGKTITAQDCAGIQIVDDLDSLTVKDLTLVGQVVSNKYKVDGKYIATEAMDAPYMGIGTYNQPYSVGALTLTDVTVQNFDYGLYFGAQAESPSAVSVDADNLVIQDCYIKGAYFENLTESSFTDCKILNNGNDDSVVNDGQKIPGGGNFVTWMCGVDVNLKYDDYKNIEFVDCTFTGNGANKGTALHIKARDDGSYGPDTTLDGVTVTGCTFQNNNAAVEAPIVLGEPGKNNKTPVNVYIQPDVDYVDNLDQGSVVTVTFNSNGGDPVNDEIVAKGAKITLPGCTHSSYHYKFDGWKCGNATYYAGDKVEVNSNMTFTAQWKERFPDGPSSGGSSSVSDNEYAVTVDAGKHGDVSVSPKWAEEGDTVTITADPDNGYVVDEVIVTDKNGDDIRVRDRGDGEYTFTMPDSKVTVEVTFVEAGDELSFVDVAKSDYYYDAVKWAVENGVTTGVTDTIFAPGNPCTRAQTVTFLWRAAGMPQAANRVNPFTDVSVNDYYYEAVLWAVENGITGGTTATTFSPNATCTRAQVVTFLWRYSKEDASILPVFTDVAEGDYYYGAVAWAVENGVTTGVTDTSFVPGNPCTRGQIVTFLYRYMGK